MAAKISIFPRDRLAWHRQMAEDVELSHVAFRLGVCIGGHFNNRTRKTFVGYEKLGQQMQVCRTTVVNAVRELAARGHLEVKAGGGRKIANEYRMILKTVQPDAPFNSRKTVQTEAQNGAADCTPTLTDLSDQNSAEPDLHRPRNALRGGEEAIRTKQSPAVFKKGSIQWIAWLRHYEIANPSRAALMRSQADSGRSEWWSERSSWPPNA
jgi:DNA-binding transcriptional MocR family regulator